MSIESASLQKDSTSAPTGGTTQSFNTLGAVGNSHRVYFDGTASLTRSRAEFTRSEPRPLATAPNGYTQARSTVNLQVPITLANGHVTVNSVNIKLAVDPETTPAQIHTLREYAAQLIYASAFDSFWQAQSLA